MIQLMINENMCCTYIVTCSHFFDNNAFIADSRKQPHRLCLLVYYIPDGFESKVKPHGNSKSAKPFYATLPSTLYSNHL